MATIQPDQLPQPQRVGGAPTPVPASPAPPVPTAPVAPAQPVPSAPAAPSGPRRRPPVALFAVLGVVAVLALGGAVKLVAGRGDSKPAARTNTDRPAPETSDSNRELAASVFVTAGDDVIGCVADAFDRDPDLADAVSQGTADPAAMTDVALECADADTLADEFETGLTGDPDVIACVLEGVRSLDDEELWNATYAFVNQDFANYATETFPECA